MSRLRVLVLAAVLLIAACSRPTKRFHPSAAGSTADYAQEEAEAEADEGQRFERAAAASAPAPKRFLSKAADQSLSLSAPAQEAPPQSPAPAPQQPAPRPASKRMVHYSGNASLRSTEPERILDSAIALVKAGGGYLEHRYAGFASLRVPSQDFDTLFLRILRLAEVIDYSQQAEDITEAYQDAEMRLKVVVATLDRLEDLVKKARTEAQKLRLLRELKRFREEREVLESRMRELKHRARFAAIHLRVETHAPHAGAGPWSQDLADFRWIHKLDPFDDARFRGRSSLKFKAPEGMIVSSRKKPWRATSSQGSEFWGSELEVVPVGDSRFWMQSIRERLGSGFKATDTASAGGFRFCSFKSYGPTPYFYWVGVRSRGDELDLAEFYFPNEDQQSKLLPGLLAEVRRKSE